MTMTVLLTVILVQMVLSLIYFRYVQKKMRLALAGDDVKKEIEALIVSFNRSADKQITFLEERIKEINLLLNKTPKLAQKKSMPRKGSTLARETQLVVETPKKAAVEMSNVVKQARLQKTTRQTRAPSTQVNLKFNPPSKKRPLVNKKEILENSNKVLTLF